MTKKPMTMVIKDTCRSYMNPGSGAWGYAQFNYDAASDTFTPDGSGANCGYGCHTIVAAKDYVFTAYGKR